MNTVVDALSRIREVNMLSFIEITSNLYDHLRGKYPDDSYFTKYWTRDETRTNITTTLTLKEFFYIASGLLYRNGKVCFPNSTGHPGLHCTLVLISTQLYWPKMCHDIYNYRTKCHQCQVNKVERLKLDFYIP